MKYISIFIFIVSYNNCFSQDIQKIEELLENLKRHNTNKIELKKKDSQQDTIAANILFQLSREYQDNNLDTAMYYAKQSLQLSELLEYKKGIGNALNSMA